MRCYQYERQNLKISKKEPTFSEISACVISKLKSVWQRASIPYVSDERITQMLKTYHTKYKTLQKPEKERKKVKSYQKKVQAFQTDAQARLFDIAACKCKEFKNCKCSKERRVHPMEQEFLLDQRTKRKMAIGSLDATTTKKNVKRLSRKQTVPVPGPSIRNDYCENELDYSTSSTSEDSEEDFTPQPPARAKQEREGIRKKSSLESLAIACDRGVLSDRAAASVASAVLDDLGMIAETGVIDRNKIRRARTAARSKMQTQDKVTEPPISIYFDGRKDKTLTTEGKGRTQRKRTINEEHITILQEPSSSYLGHVCPSSGTAESICREILVFLNSNFVDTSKIKAIGCDGTSVNTGKKGGVVALMERELKRPLQWVICMLHMNELPLRHLIIELDGPTTGPRGFTGPIGKLLLDCETYPVVKFKTVEAVSLQTDSAALSTDQRYLLDIYSAVSRGYCSDSLAQRSPGKLAHSRWLTTANRILRLYVATEQPSDTLEKITHFIMRVYAPMWFKIKNQSSLKFAAKHLYETISCAKSLPRDVFEIVKPVLQRNAYCAHPENILISMIFDDQKHIRELGWRRILNARTRSQDRSSFEIPRLNFDAEVYHHMINWFDSNVQVTEPPLTKDFPTDDINSMVKSGIFPDVIIPEAEIPCHTQAVERHIKLVTEASAVVVGAQNRDGFIRTTLRSRKIMPKFDTKSQFKSHSEN